jgi:hypothetical protein
VKPPWHGDCISFLSHKRLSTGTTLEEGNLKMATLSKTLAAFGLVLTTLSTSAFADTYHHIDELALSIAQQANLIVGESRHYRHTPEYRHIVADARELAQLADHLHELAHHHGSLTHMASDLAKLDSEFHHLESVFDRVEHHAGYGHVHGRTSHVKGLLKSIEQSIHHLQEDLASLRTPIHSARPVVVNRPAVYTTPNNNWGGYNSRPHNSGYGHGGHGNGAYGYGSRGRGISIGGGSSRFTIRF